MKHTMPHRPHSIGGRRRDTHTNPPVGRVAVGLTGLQEPPSFGPIRPLWRQSFPRSASASGVSQVGDVNRTCKLDAPARHRQPIYSLDSAKPETNPRHLVRIRFFLRFIKDFTKNGAREGAPCSCHIRRRSVDAISAERLHPSRQSRHFARRGVLVEHALGDPAHQLRLGRFQGSGSGHSHNSLHLGL